MKEIVIRQCREVTAMGVTRVRELYAQGHIDKNGVFRLERCVGRYGCKQTAKDIQNAQTNRAA